MLTLDQLLEHTQSAEDIGLLSHLVSRLHSIADNLPEHFQKCVRHLMNELNPRNMNKRKLIVAFIKDRDRGERVTENSSDCFIMANDGTNCIILNRLKASGTKFNIQSKIENDPLTPVTLTLIALYFNNIYPFRDNGAYKEYVDNLCARKSPSHPVAPLYDRLYSIFAPIVRPERGRGLRPRRRGYQFPVRLFPSRRAG